MMTPSERAIADSSPPEARSHDARRCHASCHTRVIVRQAARQSNRRSKRFSIDSSSRYHDSTISVNVPKKKDRICAYCRKRLATTKDHVIPKAIIPRPLPDDLVTVDCCVRCNTLKKPLDEDFRDLLATNKQFIDNPQFKDIRERFLRAASKNRSRLFKSSTQLTTRYEETKGGILAPAGFSLSREHIETINDQVGFWVRGLSWHQARLVCGEQHGINIIWPRNLARSLRWWSENAPGPTCVGNVVSSTFLIDRSDTRHTLWMFTIANCLAVFVETFPVATWIDKEVEDLAVDVLPNHLKGHYVEANQPLIEKHKVRGLLRLQMLGESTDQFTPIVG